MVIKYNINISEEAIIDNLNRMTNQIFKLLPLREEESDWLTPLRNLILEISGMERLVDNSLLFSLLCKLEMLITLTDKDDFLTFRKLIFECLNLLKQIKEDFE